MKIITFLSFFFLLLSCSSIAQVTHTVNFSFEELIVSEITGENSNTYTKLKYDELLPSDEIGKPELPIKFINLIIPIDQRVEEINLRITGEDTIDISNPIYPNQPPLPTLIGFEGYEFVEPDPDIYNSDDPYPSELVKVSADGYYDGINHIITLAVYPVYYMPGLNKIIFNSNIEIIMEMEATDASVLNVNTRIPSNQEMYDNILASIIDNPEYIPAYRGDHTIENTEYPPGSYEYIIITSDALKNSFDKFIKWKQRKGISIGVTTVEYILSHYSGDLISGIYDDAGKIRQYLKDAYQSGTVWVLLGGDYTIVPIRYGCDWNYDWWDGTLVPCDYQPYPNSPECYCADYGAHKIPTDLYFADFNGDWDVDADIYYGQPSDNVDYNPEIFVGRLLCSNSTATQDIANWTAKLIRYEKYPGNGDFNYLTKSFMTESDQMQHYNQAEDVTNHLPTSYMHTIWKELPSWNSLNPTFPLGTEVINEMNNHYGLYSWFHHGSPNTIAVRSTGSNQAPYWLVTTTDDITGGGNAIPESGNGLDNLANEMFPSICYSLACNNTPFDIMFNFEPCNWFTGRNLGQGFTVVTNAGGAAFLGNSRLGWTMFSDGLYKKFADLIRIGSIDPESGKSHLHLGVAEII